MKTGKLFSLLLASTVCMSVPVLGQANRGASVRPGQGARPGAARAARDYNAELQTLGAQLAKIHNVRLLVDPQLFVATPPKAPAGETIAVALDGLVASLKNAAWRRVYVNQAQSGSATAKGLAESARSLDTLEQSGLVIENPVTKRATSVLKNYQVSDTFEQDLQAGQFSAQPIYLLYATRIDPLAMLSQKDRLASLMQQQYEMMGQMSPDQMAEAMQQGMQMWMNMDPAMRGQMMGNMMRAGMQMFANMSPEQRNAMMGEMMKFGQQIFQGIQGGGRPGGP